MRRYLYEDNYKYLYSQDIYTPSYKCNNEYIHYLGCVDIYNEQELEDFVELIEKVGYNREKILKALKVDELQLMSKKSKRLYMFRRKRN